MRTIWKFPLNFDRPGLASGLYATVDMPRGAKVRHFAFEYRGPMDDGPRKGVPTLWAEVDYQAPLERREFQIIGTGHAIPDGADHIATWDAEPFVWHLIALPLPLVPAWTDWPGNISGDTPADARGDTVVDFQSVGATGDGPFWTGPANVVDWHVRGRYRLAAEQPDR